jgi:hypothetical protein
MREDIIAEIRRLAAVIGRPPGSHLFEAETGLRAHQWRGVYWARWSDALREAGLQPNSRQDKAHPDVLLEQLAVATRRLGHCPTVDELALYRRTSPAPTPSTVRLHFGRRAALIARLRQWTAARPDYADIALLLCGDTGAGDPESMEGAQGEPAEAGGVVRLYRCREQFCLARHGGADGRSRSPVVALPKSSVLEHAIYTDDPVGVETYWRRRFAYRRLDPEWFALTPRDVAAFRRWKQI